MLVRSKFFLQFVEKVERLKLSLSKQHNKMLKIKSEMMKIKKKTKKNVKISQLEKISRENFREFSGIPEKFLKISVSRIVENSRIRKTLRLAVIRTFFRSANGTVLLLFSSIVPLTSCKTIIENL